MCVVQNLDTKHSRKWLSVHVQFAEKILHNISWQKNLNAELSHMGTANGVYLYRWKYNIAVVFTCRANVAEFLVLFSHEIPPGKFLDLRFQLGPRMYWLSSDFSPVQAHEKYTWIELFFFWAAMQVWSFQSFLTANTCLEITVMWFSYNSSLWKVPYISSRCPQFSRLSSFWPCNGISKNCPAKIPGAHGAKWWHILGKSFEKYLSQYQK